MTATSYPIRATHTFPHGFKWGTATAAFQVEGQPGPSDWAVWHKLPGRIRAGANADLANDWWRGRWAEDFDLAAAAGQNAHRLGVDWSRIEPRLSVWDEDALDHYRQMVRGLRARGMEPMVTLHHFATPQWLAELGGWECPDAPRYFERFVRKVVGALKDAVDLWCTFNEINVYTYQGYLEGNWPPGKKDLGASFRATRTILEAHATAYRAIHEVQPAARVGIAHHFRPIDPANPASALDRWVASFQNRLFNDVVTQALLAGRLVFPAGQGFRSEKVAHLTGTLDFIGVNYYTRNVTAFDPRLPGVLFGRTGLAPDDEPDNVRLNGLYPEGLYRMLKWASDTGLPIYITESGWGDTDEDRRTRSLILHLRQAWRAVNFNWPLKGFYYWTLVDNFEWERGWDQAFGLYALDRETQARRPRPAALLYAEICRANALSSTMVERYAPALLPVLFPG